MQFPNVDPIPIPAPVWLLKSLGLLTLALHFFAVQMLIGSLVAVCVLNWRGRRRQDASSVSASSLIAHRLPVIMTYVINLGVPPLLFLQVLYGRAIYTSSVLIGAMWISVIFLVMGCYWLLYRTADWAKQGRPAAWPAFGALILAASVGQIYSINMSLMLRPEVWQDMYANAATGLQAPPHDPTMMPRWLFVITGGLIAGGLWIALHAHSKTVGDEVRKRLRRFGAGMTALGLAVQLPVGLLVVSRQPVEVQQTLGSGMAPIWAGVWAIAGLGALATSLIHGFQKAAHPVLGWLAPVLGLLSVGGVVLYRDLVRDITLKSKGFDVWNRVEASNWSVIGLFLALFVVGLAAIWWLLLVMRQAKPLSEEVQA